MSGNDLAGVRLYKPGMLLLYFVVGGLPLGCFAYGLNVARRGRRWIGTFLWVLASLTFVSLVAGAAVGARVSSLGILSVFIGIGVLNLESGPYKRALARGATPEKWWPPLLGAFGIILLVVILLAFVAPDGPTP